MEKRWCTACGNPFEPRPQSPRQSYCTSPECQRARRSLWQRIKRQTDPDYLENQVEAHRAWCQRNPAYWRQYRVEHPEYTVGNRARQSARNLKRRAPLIANVDVTDVFSFSSGVFRLTPVEPEKLANMGVWTVHLTLLSKNTE